jgi:histone H3/H4
LKDVNFNVPKPHMIGFYLTSHLDGGIDHIIKNKEFLSDDEIKNYGLTVLEKATTEYESVNTVRKIYKRLKDELNIEDFEGAHKKIYELVQDYFITKVENGEIKSGSELMKSILPEEEVYEISDKVTEAIKKIAEEEAEEILISAKESYNSKKRLAIKIKKHIKNQRRLT